MNVLIYKRKAHSCVFYPTEPCNINDEENFKAEHEEKTSCTLYNLNSNEETYM